MLRCLGHRFLGITSHPIANDFSKYQHSTRRYPENSIPAFKTLMAQGGYGAECDVVNAKCGTAVILHGRNLNQHLIGAHGGYVEDFTADELASLNIGHGSGIPRLSDVLDIATITNAVLNLELKGYDTATTTWECLHPYFKNGCLSPRQVIISSFDHEQLHQIYKLSCPDFPLHIGLLFRVSSETSRPCHPHTNSQAIYDVFSVSSVEKFRIQTPLFSLHPYFKDCSEPLIEYCHHNNLTLMPWALAEKPPHLDKSYLSVLRTLQAKGTKLLPITDFPFEMESALNTA